MLKNALLIGLPLLALSGSINAQSCSPESIAARNKINQLNPQPEPPGVTAAAARPGVRQLNPQPEPPGVSEQRRDVRRATFSTSSDSGNEAATGAKMAKPAQQATWAAGSDSSEEVAHPVHDATWAAGSDSGRESVKGRPGRNVTWVAGSDSGDGTRDAVHAIMVEAKYTDIHGVRFVDGAWKAIGNDAAGFQQEVTIDANDGHIVSAVKTAAELQCEQAAKRG